VWKGRVGGREGGRDRAVAPSACSPTPTAAARPPQRGVGGPCLEKSDAAFDLKPSEEEEGVRLLPLST